MMARMDYNALNAYVWAHGYPNAHLYGSDPSGDPLGLLFGSGGTGSPAQIMEYVQTHGAAGATFVYGIGTQTPIGIAFNN